MTIRASLMFVAIAPLIAVAGESGGESLKSKVDVQKLQDDIQISNVLDATVQTQNGQEAGDVEDVEISSDGRIESVLINADNEQTEQQQASDSQNAQRSREGGAQSGGGLQSVGEVTNEGLRKVQWDQVKYDPQNDTVQVSASGGASSSSDAFMGGSPSAEDTRISATDSAGQSASSPGAAQSQQDLSGGIDTFRASELVGMEVHLADAVSFGEVDDVLVNEQEGKATALVVSAWEGLDQQTYALPVELQSANREDGSITYKYTESDVIALQEFKPRSD